jgi:syntaxin of plants SYP6
MPSAEDPFDVVRADVVMSLAALDSDFSQWRKNYAALSSPNPGAALSAFESSTAAVTNLLHSVEWDLQDLDEAVRVAAASPERFALSPAGVLARRASVVQLRKRVHDMQEAVGDPGIVKDVDSAKRVALLSSEGQGRQHIEAFAKSRSRSNSRRVAGGANRTSNGSGRVPASGAGTGHSISRPSGSLSLPMGAGDDEMIEQDLLVREQDQGLDDLSAAVQRIGHMGKEMHNELQEHSVMLDGLESGFDDTTTRMGAVQRKLDEFANETSRGQFCTIVVLLFTFIFLTFLVVAT